jgi:hypothetical protein
MKRPIMTATLLLISCPVLAAINPLHDPVVVPKSTRSVDMAILSRGEERAGLPLECRGFYVRPHKKTAVSRCE